MYLKRLDIQGFKTFASRTVLEFRPGITAVVGPNGSGKSNIADAVRWVLGEQSYATLRSKRTEDLIYSGGGKRAPSGLAEVSLTIDNSDRLLPLPYGEVTITRRATRAGENEYFINRNRVRLRDIQEAIGPLGGSYTIINQGLVDAALTLKPEERRRLFEDAAEIGIYQSRKSDAEHKLRETNTNVERSADVLAELEPRLRSLKRQASLARTHREYTTELHELLIRYYAQVWHEAQEGRTRTEQIEQQQSVLLAERRAAQAAVTLELREAREQLRALREQLQNLHNQSSALHTRAEAAQRDLAVAAERRVALERREEEAERVIRDLLVRREELEQERATILTRQGQAEERLAEARRIVAEREAVLQSHEAERRAARARIEAAQREELAAQTALADAKRRQAAIASRREQLTRELHNQAETLRAAEAQRTARQQAQSAAEQALRVAEQARTTAAAAEEQARTTLEHLRAERQKADESAAIARRSLADLEARLESLTRLQRSYAGTFAGVKVAMQWAEAQQRQGFALVSSIIHTPAEIETAIEVALGSRLQNIVVERWEDAEDAIAALKRSGSGRATFLPLDTIRRSQSDDRRPSGAGVLGVAADLVDFDEHYRPVVQNLLGRTLVVEDLQIARSELRKLGGGWTIVTLAGEQVNSSGAVTGGAQIKESGTLRRERELRELPQEVETARHGVERAQQARDELANRLQQAERELREAEQLRRQRNRELDTQREQEAQARREMERAESALELQRRRHDQASTEITALDEQEQALQNEQLNLAQREAESQQQLLALRNDDQARAEADQQARRALDDARAAAAAVEGELRAERALLQSQDQQLARLEGQHEAARRSREDLLHERDTLAAQIQERETTHGALLAQIDELRAQIDPAEGEVAARDGERTALEERETALTAQLLEAESAYTRATLDLQRSKDRLDTLWDRAAADDIDVDSLPTLEQLPQDTLVSPSHTQENPATPEAGATPAQEHSLQERIQSLRSRIARLGAVNPLALEEYEQESQRYEFMTTQLDDLRQAAETLRSLIAELDEAMRVRFEMTFQAIAVEFEKTFSRLFGGGQAQLTLSGAGGEQLNSNGVGEINFDTLGVEIAVRPPGKRQQNISLLSGGERTLTAAALLFAILAVNPSPFCILDETDAALDEANVGRFRNLLEELGAQTQFLLITHNRGTIEAAETIYGVSMGDDGASKILSLRLEELGVE